MSWRRYDDKFERHPKVLALIEKTGFEGYYRLMRLHGYAAEFHTDGRLPKVALSDSGVKPKQVQAMIAVGLLDRDEQGDLAIHDWLFYNPKDPDAADRMRRLREQRKAEQEANIKRTRAEQKPNAFSRAPSGAAPEPDARVPTRPEELSSPQPVVVSVAAGSGNEDSELEQLGNSIARRLGGIAAARGTAERVLELLDPAELVNGSEQRIRSYCDVLSVAAIEQARTDLEHAVGIRKSRTAYVMGILERKAKGRIPA